VLDDEYAADASLREHADVRVAKGAGQEPGSEPFTIALASREPLPETLGVVVLGGLADTALSAELERTRERAHSELEEMQRVEASLREDAATLLRELDDKRAELRSVYASVSWRLTEPLRRAKRLRGR
jgi:hypothetical protein